MIEVFEDIIQGTDEWLRVRAGIPTASRFADVMAKKGPRGGIPKGRAKYMRVLAGEVITGEPAPSYSNAHMARGTDREAEARDLYAVMRDVDPVQVGFIRNGHCGGSPDSLVGNAGMVEIKDAIPDIQIERLEAGTLPSEHKAQCMGNLMVADREWIDFVSHSRGLPPLIVRVYRDETYIKELAVAVAQFVEDLHEKIEWIRNYQPMKESA